MEKQNCWEFKNCGREPGGAKASELGACIAATYTSANGLNEGNNGGRICLAIPGTLCGGKVQGTFPQKHISCLTCDFFKNVNEEEKMDFLLLLPGQEHRFHE